MTAKGRALIDMRATRRNGLTLGGLGLLGTLVLAACGGGNTNAKPVDAPPNPAASAEPTNKAATTTGRKKCWGLNPSQLTAYISQANAGFDHCCSQIVAPRSTSPGAISRAKSVSSTNRPAASA